MDNPDKYFSCKNLKYFINTIVEVLPFSGVSGSKFFMCDIQGQKFLTKLSLYYKTDPELYGRHHIHHQHPIDAEMTILDIFKREFIDTNITPFILQLLYSKKCLNITQMLPENVKCDQYVFIDKFTDYENYVYNLFCEYNKMITAGLARDSLAFIIMERGDITFRTYLEEYNDKNKIDVVMFKSLLFQIMYTLYRIKKRFPKFRHGDLHTDNIILMFDSEFTYNPDNITYLIFGKKSMYMIPYFGVICKIIDFGYSTLPEFNIVSNIADDKKWLYYSVQNDAIALLCSIYDSLRTKKHNKFAIGILTALDSSKTFLHCDAEYANRTRMPTITEMMDNKIWDVYRTTTLPPLDHIYKHFDG